MRILERKLGAVCRKVAMRVVSDGVKSISVTGDNVEEFLGIRRYHPERLPRTEQVGVVNGLAWTSVGGELLEVEVNVVPGSGKLQTHRKPGRCHEGVGPRGLLLHSQPGGPPGHRGRLLSEEGHPCPLSGRSSAQGRPLSGHRHHHRHGLGADQYAGAAGAGDDRRGDAARPGAGHWRPEGEDHGRPGATASARCSCRRRTRRIWRKSTRLCAPRCTSCRWSRWTRCWPMRWDWMSHRARGSGPKPRRRRPWPQAGSPSISKAFLAGKHFPAGTRRKGARYAAESEPCGIYPLGRKGG